MCFPEGRFIDLWEDKLKTARLIARPRLRSRLHGFALLSRHDEWWSINELLHHATEVCMGMGPTYVENYTFLTAYPHSWAGGTEPIQEAHRASSLGLIHWADQPSKQNIYLVSQDTDGCHLGTDDGDGYPGKLWCIRIIKVVTNSILASPPLGRSLTTERGPKQRAIKKLDLISSS